jgi:hypothetical protein
MTLITIKLTPAELSLLSSLASDQLFRREFIDSRIPGFRSDDEGLTLGKRLVERLRILIPRDPSKRPPPPRRPALRIPHAL